MDSPAVLALCNTFRDTLETLGTKMTNADTTLGLFDKQLTGVVARLQQIEQITKDSKANMQCESCVHEPVKILKVEIPKFPKKMHVILNTRSNGINEILKFRVCFFGSNSISSYS